MIIRFLPAAFTAHRQQRPNAGLRDLQMGINLHLAGIEDPLFLEEPFDALIHRFLAPIHRFLSFVHRFLSFVHRLLGDEHRCQAAQDRFMLPQALFMRVVCHRASSAAGAALLGRGRFAVGCDRAVASSLSSWALVSLRNGAMTSVAEYNWESDT